MVAVVDYKLPGLSGIDLCRTVRQDDDLFGVKLILFTGDEDPGIRKEALQAGADDVVLKSPEASVVIEAVLKLLEKK